MCNHVICNYYYEQARSINRSMAKNELDDQAYIRAGMSSFTLLGDGCEMYYTLYKKVMDGIKTAEEITGHVYPDFEQDITLLAKYDLAVESGIKTVSHELRVERWQKALGKYPPVVATASAE